ncbi:MAG: TolC family protein [Acidobacteriota bacterium]|nr:TolC family protein [Acidobacteriota bacterium]
MRTLPLARVFVVLLLGAALGAAQEPALDLKATLAEAASNNLEVRAAREQRAQAIAGLSIARQIPNPFFSFAALRDTPHESVVVDQSIELGGKRGQRIGVAQQEQRAIEIQIDVLTRQVRRRTREAFYRTLWARAARDQLKAAEAIAVRTRDIVKDRFEAGDVAEFDVLQADVESTRAAVDAEAAIQSLRSTDALLAGLLNRKLDQPLPLAGRLDEVPPNPTLDGATRLALTSNAGVQLTAQELKTEERRLGLAKAQRIPNLELQAGVDLNSPPDFNVGPRGQVGVTLPLFYHGQGEVALSNAKLRFLRLALEALRTTTSAQVAAAYFDYQAKAYQAQQYKARIVPAASRLEQMAEDSYRSGKTNLLTLIDAQRKLNEIQRAYLDTLLAAQTSFANLEEMVGADLD